MIVARSRTELTMSRRRVVAPGERLALVPTMGALHEGHLALVDAARSGAARVAVSLFVNPTQFDDVADLARYPVDHARDLALLEDRNVDLVWLPTRDDVYRPGHATVVAVDGPSRGFEGALRPGHFRGVATVVAILFGTIRPDVAWFGEKDWQQLQVIRRMVDDLGLPVEIASLPTVRQADGLAMSSRNRFLDEGARATAPVLAATLRDISSAIVAGVAVERAIDAGRTTLASAGFETEYLALVRGATLEPIDTIEADARMIAAARLGRVRLLDNVAVVPTRVAHGILAEQPEP